MHLTEEEEAEDSPAAGAVMSPTGGSGSGSHLLVAKSRQDPETQIQMSSVQSLVTLQGNNRHLTTTAVVAGPGHRNDKDGKASQAVSKDLLSAGEIDDFSLF